jgi:peptidoglycan/xylan/chitin deacetylase (PgdA/CDA1 family)
MTLCFRFDEHAWRLPGARHTIDTLRLLLDVPGRLAAPGAPVGRDELRIDVGAAAGDDAAVHVPVRAWPVWEPAEVIATSAHGVPLLRSTSTPPEAPDARSLPSEWLRGAAFVLHREEEEVEPHRDEWDCFNGFSSRLHELGLLETPLLHGYARLLADRVEAAFAAAGREAPRVPRWPEGRSFAAILSHDVDWLSKHSLRHALRLLRQARRPRDYALRQGVTSLALAVQRPPAGTDPFWNFERWMDAEAAHGFRSTFYFCHPWAPKRHPYDPTYLPSDELRFRGDRVTLAVMMRRMRDSGFEVGLHGSYRSHSDAETLGRERAGLERALDAPVAGVRQHFLRFDIRSTWRAQQSAGFGYDSTMGFNEVLGFRCGLAIPFHPAPGTDRVPLSLIELPMTAMDGVLFRTMKLSGPLAARRLVAHLEATEAAGGLAVLLWHPNAADESGFPGWWDAYRAALGHLAVRGAWVATAREVAMWWRDRSERMTVQG